MIPVKKNIGAIPRGLTTPGAKKKIKQVLAEKNAHIASADYYAHDSVKTALNSQYGNKCAYCECLIEEQADRRVDHYRPKKARDQAVSHPGYYWLTYEWSNLILSCATCNLKKSNHFPIAGTRVITPPQNREDWHSEAACMGQEQPLILNPEVDDPTEHLYFSPDGRVHPKENSLQGAKTIEVCNLNREALILARKKLMDGFRENIKSQILLLLAQSEQGLYPTPASFNAALTLGFQDIVAKLKAAPDPKQPFSRVGWHMNHDPQPFLLQTVPEGEQRSIALKALKYI